MHVLIMNWRSIRDPLAGGAEMATFEHARRWVKDHQLRVTWLSPVYNKNITRESYEGVDFEYISLPLGRSIPILILTVPYFYLSVFFTYMSKYRGKVDVVIDQVHGFPYLTPLYVKEKVILHVNEVAGNIWDIMYSFPINEIGKLMEILSLKLYFFKSVKILSISESTKKDLMKLGAKEENVRVVYCGINTPVIKEMVSKEKRFTIIFLNRLVRMKGIERAIEVVTRIRKDIPDLQFWVVGRGGEDYTSYVKEKVRLAGLAEQTIFWGYVTEEQKVDLLTKAHVLINTSYKEGWGLVNIEANTRGTPAVAFEVEGNIESVNNGVSGYLVKDGDIEDMASKILLLKDDVQIRESAIEYARSFDWDRMSDKYYDLLKGNI